MIRRSFIVVSLIVASSAMGLLPAGAASDASTRTVARTATFQTKGQSLWGPGTGQGLASDVPFFDLPWNESGSIGSIASICVLWIPGAGCLEYADFGAKLEGSTSGRVGLGAHFELGSGALAIDYPVRVSFRVPQSFIPGKWATIGSDVGVLPGARITTATPDGHIDLNGAFGFSASATAKACIVDCAESTSSVNIPTTSGRLFRIDSSTVYYFTEEGLALLGLSGSVQLPDLRVGQTTVNPDGSLSASGSGEYAELGISAIEWAMKLAGIDLPLNFDLPLCCGMSAGYTTFDSIFSVKGEASQALRFQPKVRLTLKFPRALNYVVHQLNGDKASGRAKEVTLWAGEKVRIRVPANQTRALAIVPTARINGSTVHNRMTTDISFGGEVKALEAHASVPEYPPVFDGVDYVLGPVYSQGYPIAQIPTIDVWSDRWPVGGFSSVGMKPFALAPA